MKFYSHFQYQYTEFYSTVQDCIAATKKPKNTLQLSWVYQVTDNGHKPVRVIVNGRAYGHKHARSNGFRNVIDFGKSYFRTVNNIA